jgi:hypothetical protein
MTAPNNILLGDGVFALNGSDIALTRGGGQLTIKRDLRQIEADGDFGPVKGRIRKVKSVCTLKLNLLEIIPTDMDDYYPGLTVTSIAASDTISAASDVADTDYSTVTWTGETKDGRAVVITLSNAINLEDIDWEMKDKDEVVPEITYTATYTEAARTTEPWSIVFATAAGDDATAPIMIPAAVPAGTWLYLTVGFNEKLHADTYAISDITNLLSALTNGAVPIAVTTVANSVVWFDTLTQNPKCVIKIPSTVFVAGVTLRFNAKASAIKDVSGNLILAATNFDTVITA